MTQDHAGSPARIDFLDLEPLPLKASDAATIRVFRHVAAYYGQEAHRALAGMMINLGGSMIAVAQKLHHAAAALEKAALSHVPLATVDLELLRDAETVVGHLAERLDHEPLHACRRELARRQHASQPAVALSDIEQAELARGAASFLSGTVVFRPVRRKTGPRVLPNDISLRNWNRPSGASLSRSLSTTLRRRLRHLQSGRRFMSTPMASRGR